MNNEISLIKIVKNPSNKNCWLAVDNFPFLKELFSDLITDYDFIDFEGEVFYYDIITTIKNGLSDSYIYDFERQKLINSQIDIKDIEKYIHTRLVTEFKIQIADKFEENNKFVLLKRMY